MTTATPVTRTQRFTNNNRCPICGGYDTQARGKSERCFGFVSSDFEYAHCTREELAGGLLIEENANTYAHRIVGDCRCGVRHDRRPATNGRVVADVPRSTNGTGSRIVAEYDYRDEAGAVLYQCVRKEPKDFRQRRRDRSGDWAWNLNGVRLVPYRLPELLAADPSETVFICEGEKDVDALAALGLVATTNAMGAKKWRDEYSEHLRSRHVCLLPDNDADGREHGRRVALASHGIAASVRVLALPGLPEHGDVSDWLAAGGTGDQLRAMATAAPEWTPAEHAAEPPRGESLPLADILDDVRAFCSRFIAYPDEHTRTAHTLWIAHTHCMDAWDSTPRLAALSPEPGSGKTRVLEVSELLVPRPIPAMNVTPAYLFRTVADPAGRPTILHDEIDTVFGPKAKANEDLRGLLNAGHRKGAVAGRCVVKGKEILTEEIPAYCAVALAGLGGLPDTLISRSIVIRMKRRAPTETIEPFRRRVHEAEGHALRDQLADWALGATPALREAWPAMPPTVTDRDADKWEPLIAIADLAGGEWPARARVTAVTLVTQSKVGTPSLGVRLLADLRTVFADADSLPTTELLAALYKLDESPWADLRGKPLDARGLARRLSAYDINRTTIRVGTVTAKGYKREDCFDAFSRYLTPLTPPTVAAVTSVTFAPAADDDHCRECGATVTRFTDSGGAYCETHWAMAQHNERMATA